MKNLLRAMTDRGCPVCGPTMPSRCFVKANLPDVKLDKYAFASRKTPEYLHYQLNECQECGLLFAGPVAQEDSVVEAYHTADFDSAEESDFASETYINLVKKIRLSDRDRALDIGAGDGRFLKRLLDYGFKEVVGVEPSSAPIQAAPEPVRPFIRQGLFRKLDFEESSFSLITCFQTLEHLYYPSIACEKIFKLLKPGGAVLFVSHDRNGLSTKLLGFKSPIFDIEHLQLFSKKSLLYFLGKNGFKGNLVFDVSNKYPLHYWFKLFPVSRSLKTAWMPRLKNSSLGRMPIGLNVGNIAGVGYKP